MTSAEQALAMGAVFRERMLVGAVARQPSELLGEIEALSIADLEDQRHAITIDALRDADAAGEDLSDVVAVRDALRRRGVLDAIGGDLGLAQILDEEAVPSHVPGLVREVRIRAIRRTRARLLRGAADDYDGSVVARLEALDREEAALRAGESGAGGLQISDVGFTGADLLALLTREPAAPIEAAKPPRGHFTLLIAPSMTGKSSLTLWLAMAHAAGVEPWGAPCATSPSRVLLFSLDEAPEQIARRANSLSVFHPAGRLERYANRLTVIGPDRERDVRKLDALRFDERGLATLARWLEDAERAGDPFTDVVVDAYADTLPLDKGENDNGEGTRIGGALERLAVRFGCAILVLHHVGKPKADAPKDALPDVRFLARGATSLAAKARTVFSLELVPGMPHLRRVRTATNLGPSPSPALFQVCGEDSPGESILYFRPAAEPSARSPRDYLEPGEWINTTELARRLSGDALGDGAKVPTEFKTMASRLRDAWREAGLIDVRPGKQRAKELALRVREEGEPS